MREFRVMFIEIISPLVDFMPNVSAIWEILYFSKNNLLYNVINRRLAGKLPQHEITYGTLHTEKSTKEAEIVILELTGLDQDQN